MEHVIRALFRAILILYMAEMLPLTTNGSLPAHCLQTTANRKLYKAQDILLSRLNGSEYLEPPEDADDMAVDLCPNNTFLKFSWKMKRSQGIKMKLCYRMKSIENGRLLYSSCVKFLVQYSKRRIQMTCWFPMDYLSLRPIINVLATSVEDAQGLGYYGELNTNGLDLTDSCKSVCEANLMDIKAVIYCNDKSSILFDDNISIQRIYFDSIDSNVCKDTSIEISGQKSNTLDYLLNCTYDGRGHVKVLYSIRGYYCFKYHTVTVICDSASTTHVFSPTTEPPADNFLSLVIFGVLCLFCVAIISYFVTQRLRHFVKDHIHFNGDLVNRHASERIPLQEANGMRLRESDASSSSTVSLTTQV